MKVLVTGGAGYIGSHTCVELLEQGYEVLVLDNLVNSSQEAVLRVQEISGKAVELVVGDVNNRALLDDLFSRHTIATVIHFAGLKAVGESTQLPLDYFANNVAGTLSLLQAMQAAQVFRFVFSSSATVYGDPHQVPIREDFPLQTTNPYGRSKLMVEQICRDLADSDERWHIALLRYFNPVGAHPSGRIGEQPDGVPNNLLPFITQVAIGQRPALSVFGNDYPTADGTGVRDYLHVVDLAQGHLSALGRLTAGSGCQAYNLGTGQGYSVLEMIRAFEEASGRPIPYRIVGRRPGDIASCYADPALAAAELNWRASKGLADMMQDAWRWQRDNPSGYSAC